MIPEHKLTLADLETGRLDRFIVLLPPELANHVVEMKQALTEALEVLESARRYRDRMFRTEQQAGWLELHMRLNDFHENWPGLVSKKG